MITGDNVKFEWTIKQRPEKPKKLDHLYTVDPNGEGVGPRGIGCLEGVCGYVYATEQPNTRPLYRLYNGALTDHFYTLDSGWEGSATQGWNYEKIECWMLADKSTGAVSLYRWWGKDNHFYTTASDGEMAQQMGYNNDGGRACIFPTQVAGTVPLYRWLTSV